jgi:hypothetical protein
MIADFRVEFFFAFLANEAKLPDNNVCIGGKVYPEYQRYVSRGIRRLSFAKTSSAFSFNNLGKPHKHVNWSYMRPMRGIWLRDEVLAKDTILTGAIALFSRSHLGDLGSLQGPRRSKPRVA